MNLKNYLKAERGRASALASALKQQRSFVYQIANDLRPCPSHLLDGIKKFSGGEVDLSTLRTTIRIPAKASNE